MFIDKNDTNIYRVFNEILSYQMAFYSCGDLNLDIFVKDFYIGPNY